MNELLFPLTNHHRLPPPSVPDAPHLYRGYFENQYGEQLLFVFDRRFGTGALYHGDQDWGGRPVLEGVAQNIVLNEVEAAWLSACWQAAVFTQPEWQRQQAGEQ